MSDQDRLPGVDWQEEPTTEIASEKFDEIAQLIDQDIKRNLTEKNKVVQPHRSPTHPCRRSPSLPSQPSA